MNHRLAAVLLATSALLAAACGDDEPTEPQQTASVRVINASSSTANVDVRRGNQTITTAPLAFRGFTATCLNVPAGNQTLTFRAPGTSVDLATTGAFNFAANQKYTVVLFGTGSTRTATVFSDAFTAPQTGNNAIRFINATATAGDVFVTTPTGAISGSPAVSNLAANAASTSGSAGFGTYPAANTRIRLFNVGTTTGTPRADFTLTNVPANGVTTVVLTGAGGSTSDPQAFAVTPCP